MAAQVPARSIANAQLMDQRNVVNSAPVKITQGLGIAVELLLIKCSRSFKHSSRIVCLNWGSTLSLEVGHSLTERQMAGQLHKANEIPALTATMTIEKIFAGINVERRP